MEAAIETREPAIFARQRPTMESDRIASGFTIPRKVAQESAARAVVEFFLPASADFDLCGGQLVRT